jgi:hypothetical protein
MMFFLHGSMGTEVVPERFLHAFMRSDPDLFPREDLANFGLVPDPAFGWPIGLSRRDVPHLANLSSVRVNYDRSAMGYADEGPYVLDASGPSQSTSGHDYGVALTEAQKRDPIEYLKTL